MINKFPDTFAHPFLSFLFDLPEYFLTRGSLHLINSSPVFLQVDLCHVVIIVDIIQNLISIGQCYYKVVLSTLFSLNLDEQYLVLVDFGFFRAGSFILISIFKVGPLFRGNDVIIHARTLGTRLKN